MVMNPYYYLYYKISRILNKKGNNAWGAMYALSLLIFVNLIVIYINVFHVTKENFISSGYKIGLIIIGIVLFITNYALFLHKNNYKQIIKRYEKETLRSRRIGSLLVILYFIITLLSIFFA